MLVDPTTALDFRLVRKQDPFGKKYLALNLGREYLETSIFLTREDLEFLLSSQEGPVGNKIHDNPTSEEDNG